MTVGLLPSIPYHTVHQSSSPLEAFEASGLVVRQRWQRTCGRGGRRSVYGTGLTHRKLEKGEGKGPSGLQVTLTPRLPLRRVRVRSLQDCKCADVVALKVRFSFPAVEKIRFRGGDRERQGQMSQNGPAKADTLLSPAG